MNADVFGQWLSRRGLCVVRTTTSYWYNQGRRLYTAFPFHALIQPSRQELRSLLARERAIAVRYSTPLDMAEGKVSYHVVCEEPRYNLEHLSVNTRSKVRRGLKRCRVEPITLERLADDGWLLQRDTLERQGRTGSMSQDSWRQICLAACGLPGFEAWGAVVGGELAASMLAVRIDDAYALLYQPSHRRYASLYVNNALSYVLTREMLSRPGARMVFYGLQSVDAPASLDRYKLSMGYSARPVRERVVFHPWLAPLFNRASHALLKRALQARPHSHVLAKAEGMISFYLEGKRPPDQQSWPQCLMPRAPDLFGI